MKVLLNIALEKFESKINRQFEVDENISLIDLCEFIIISMNGSKIPIYEFECGFVTYYPNLVEETEFEKKLENLLFKDLNLEKNKCFTLKYDPENGFLFKIKVNKIYESEDKLIFKVLSGKGYGILDNMDLFHLRIIFNTREDYLNKTEKEYLQKEFDCKECNKKIADYIIDRESRLSPKRYVFNVSLDGFDKEIKRKIVVNNNILIDDFCERVILSMNGDLSHSYCIKIRKIYLDEAYNDLELFNLDVKEKQRFKIVYDFGDNGVFNLTLSKIIDGYGSTDFEVLSGKGYGIIEDVGGPWGLEDIFYGNDTSFGNYDINEFDLEKCNERVRK